MSGRKSRRSREGGGRKGSAGSEGLGGDRVEGRRAVLELLRARRRRVHSLIVATGDDEVGFTEILAAAQDADVAVRRVDSDELTRAAYTDTPQGVVARAEPVSEARLGPLAGADDAFLLVLDGVTDPRNLGAVLRTADASGATGVVVGRHRGARLTPAAVKAASGAVEHVPIVRVGGVPGALERVHQEGCWVVGLDERGATDIADVALLDQPVALVLGAEGAGMSRLARERSDVLARIPMHGALESLNVSAAAAVAAYAVARARHHG